MTAADRSVRLLWIPLALLVAARAVLTFLPSSWLWGLNLQRYLPPLWAWVPWAVAAATLATPVGRTLAPPLEKFGDALSRPTVVPALVLAVAAGLLIWLLPDRLRYTGDSILRLGAVMRGESPDVVSPQTFPLDKFLHYTLPRGLMRAPAMDAERAVRVIGSLGAAALAAAACWFARAIGVRGAAASASVAMVLFGGYLCLFTGENKAFAELCVACVAFAAFALTAVREGSGLLRLGILLAVALLLHRYAIGLLPAFALVWLLWLRTHPGRRLAVLTSGLVPLVALAVMLPRLWSTATRFDVSANFLTSQVVRRGVVVAASDPLRIVDLLNILFMLSPLALVVPFLAAARWRETLGTREGAVLLTLALPFAVVMFLTHPPGGLIRYWDVFSPAGLVCSMLVAWIVAGTLERSRNAWLAAAVVAASAVPSVQWLAHFADPARGVKRIESLVQGPPQRSADEVWSQWEFLGWSAFQRDDMAGAARAWSRAAAAAPDPRTLVQWGMAEYAQGHRREGRALYQQSVTRDSNLALGWFGVAVAAIFFDDLDEAARAARHLQRLAPKNPKTGEILRYLETARARRPLGTPPP